MTSQLPSTILPCTIVRTRVLKRYLPKYYRLEEVLRSFSFDATHTHTHVFVRNSYFAPKRSVSVVMK